MKQSKVNQTNKSYDFDDTYYASIASNYIDILVSDLNSSDKVVDEFLPSDRLDAWFNQYNKSHNKNNRFINMFGNAKESLKIAIILLVMISSSLLIFNSHVQGFKVKFMNWVIEDNQSYTNVTVEENITALPDDFNNNIYKLAYLPSGYELLSIENFNSNYIITYTNGDSKITFGQAPNGTDFQLDTENAITNNITIDDTKLLHIYKNHNILFWNNEESSFYLISDTDINELLECVKNLKK